MKQMLSSPSCHWSRCLSQQARAQHGPQSCDFLSLDMVVLLSQRLHLKSSLLKECVAEKEMVKAEFLSQWQNTCQKNLNWGRLALDPGFRRLNASHRTVWCMGGAATGTMMTRKQSESMCAPALPPFHLLPSGVWPREWCRPLRAGLLPSVSSGNIP